ncbi:hypothetical protein ACO0LF_09575 [Undibacterium sp. Di27W]|uniref:hypothetical protein n=1 Tax=Undibacterium sp. Di27W TaxID=3413036 RepID=UPI003BF14E6E
MNKNPALSEKELRALLRANKQTLKAMTLPQALRLMAAFYQDARDYDVIQAEGDGLVVYEDITNRGGGTRFEIGIVRLFCLPHDQAATGPQPALRLRLCYKLDMGIVTELMAEDTWSYDCWSVPDMARLLESVEKEPAYRLLHDTIPAEVNINLEETTYQPAEKHPRPDAQQNWWGVWDQF